MTHLLNPFESVPMIRMVLATAVALAVAPAAFAHFVFVIPEKDGSTLRVVMSESLDADPGVELGPVAKLKLQSRNVDGKESPLELKAHDHHLTGPVGVRQVVFGSLDYGVTQRGDTAFLLKYHPKAIVGSVPANLYRVGKRQAEIVPVRSDDGVCFLVSANDSPVANTDVTVIHPDGTSKTVKTDADGRTPKFAPAGRYGVWGRVVENVAGEHDGKKYGQVRHYPTLVFDYSPYPALPEAVSSFGAAVTAEGVYVYGGHRSKVHTYNTEAVSGAWRRLDLAKPTAWSELPAGPGMQGLALVAYQGKLIRIGGMVPHNKPGTPTDNHSTADCAIYDPATKQWSAFPPLPVPRSSHDAVVVGDSLIVIGGWNMRGGDGTDWCEDGVILNLKEQAAGWKSIPQPFARRALQTGVHQGKVYVAGGLDEDGDIIGAVSIFDPATRTWSDGPELPGGKKVGFNPGICSLNGRLFVSVGDGTVARLSADGKRWEPIAKATPRIVHRMVPAGSSTLLLIGGAHKGDNLDAVEPIAIPGG